MDCRGPFLAMLAGLLAGCVYTAPESQKPFTYLCERGVTIDVAFGADSGRLRGPGVELGLAAQPAGSGFRYTGEGHELRGKDHLLTWTQPSGEIQQCREEGWAMKQPQIQPPIASLAGTRWTLAHFESSDDTVGRIVPPRLERYTMAFGEDGSVALQLDCNRANARWTVEPSSASGGGISFTPGMMTRAMCGPDAMDNRIAADLTRIRSYTLRGDTLNLALEADGGIYTWVASGAE